MTDSYGQDIERGDLVVVVTGRTRSGFNDRPARIIKVDAAVHYIDYAYGTPRKASGRCTMIKIPSTPQTLVYEKVIDEFYADWVKTHKEFR